MHVSQLESLLITLYTHNFNEKKFSMFIGLHLYRGIPRCSVREIIERWRYRKRRKVWKTYKVYETVPHLPIAKMERGTA